MVLLGAGVSSDNAGTSMRRLSATASPSLTVPSETGMENEKLLPRPNSDVAVRLPPCNSTRSRAMVRPRPVPP